MFEEEQNLDLFACRVTLTTHPLSPFTVEEPFAELKYEPPSEESPLSASAAEAQHFVRTAELHQSIMLHDTDGRSGKLAERHRSRLEMSASGRSLPIQLCCNCERPALLTWVNFFLFRLTADLRPGNLQIER